jgi:hypothetical protein
MQICLLYGQRERDLYTCRREREDIERGENRRDRVREKERERASERAREREREIEYVTLSH